MQPLIPTCATISDAAESILGPPAPAALRSALSDPALIGHMLRIEAAAGAVAGTLGAIPPEAVEVIASVCQAAAADEDVALRMQESLETSGNPVVGLVAELRRQVGAVDGRFVDAVHLGLTSQDVLDTALLLQIGEGLAYVEGELGNLGGVLAELAQVHRTTAMCGRTLTQHALPITFGLKCAHWLAAVAEVRSRVRRLRGTLPVQAGGPVGSLDRYPDDGPEFAEELARALGLEAPLLPWHTNRLPILDIAATLAACAGVTAKLATDLLVLVQPEVAEVRLAGAGRSSSMPHKANPAQAIHVIAAAREAPWALGLLAQALVSENERAAGAWQSEWRMLRSAALATGTSAHWCSRAFRDLEVDSSVMRQRVEESERLRAAPVGDLDRCVIAAQRWIDRTLAAWANVHGND